MIQLQSPGTWNAEPFTAREAMPNLGTQPKTPTQLTIGSLTTEKSR